MNRATLRIVQNESLLSARFSEFIDRSGLTQTEIAKRMGIHIPTVTNLKNGKQAWTEDLIRAAARAFNISVSQFWGESAYNDADEDDGSIRVTIPSELKAQWEKLLKEELRSPENMIEKLIRDRLRVRHLQVVADRQTGENDS